jgi:hypothetical protein
MYSAMKGRGGVYVSAGAACALLAMAPGCASGPGHNALCSLRCVCVGGGRGLCAPNPHAHGPRSCSRGNACWYVQLRTSSDQGSRLCSAVQCTTTRFYQSHGHFATSPTQRTAGWRVACGPGPRLRCCHCSMPTGELQLWRARHHDAGNLHARPPLLLNAHAMPSAPGSCLLALPRDSPAPAAKIPNTAIWAPGAWAPPTLLAAGLPVLNHTQGACQHGVATKPCHVLHVSCRGARSACPCHPLHAVAELLLRHNTLLTILIGPQTSEGQLVAHACSCCEPRGIETGGLSTAPLASVHCALRRRSAGMAQYHLRS